MKVDTLAYIQELVQGISDSQTTIINSLDGVKNRLTRLETIKNYADREFKDIQGDMAGIKDTTEKENEKIEVRFKEMGKKIEKFEKFKNYGTAAWVACTIIMSILIPILTNVFSSSINEKYSVESKVIRKGKR